MTLPPDPDLWVPPPQFWWCRCRCVKQYEMRHPLVCRDQAYPEITGRVRAYMLLLDSVNATIDWGREKDEACYRILVELTGSLSSTSRMV